MPAKGQVIDKTVPRLCAKGLHLFTGERCRECQNKRANDDYHRRAKNGTAWYQQNPQKHKESWCMHYQNNKERYKEKWKKWRDNNIEYDKTRNKNYAQSNPDVIRRNAAKRRANKKTQTPSWANLAEIARIYKECPEGCHVDHIYPLKSPIMCGLHVENNLQYLPAIENMRKGNRITLEQQLNAFDD
jgi:hypothetical protein